MVRGFIGFVVSIKKTENGFHGLSGEIYSREQSGFLSANYACACKTAVLKNCFSNPFSDFPKKTERKGIQEQVF